MDLSTRVHNLTIEKRILLLAHRLKRRTLFSGRWIPAETHRELIMYFPWEIYRYVRNPQLSTDRQHRKRLRRCNTRSREIENGLVAYLVLSDRTIRLMDSPSTDSNSPSRVPHGVRIGCQRSKTRKKIRNRIRTLGTSYESGYLIL